LAQKAKGKKDPPKPDNVPDPEDFPRLHPRSVQSAIFINLLKEGSPGDEVTDLELSELLGSKKNITGPGQKFYQTLLGAQRYVVRAYGVVWYRVRKEYCLRCGNSEEIVAKAGSARRRASKISSRAVEELSTVDRDGLGDKEKDEYNALSFQHNALSCFATTEATNALVKAKVDPQVYFDVSNLVKVFTSVD
jgi:hypothetical protein